MNDTGIVWGERTVSLMVSERRTIRSLALLVVVADIGLAGASPGGLKAHQLQLGACGIVLAVLGIIWAGSSDGLAALGYDPAAGHA